MGLYSFGAIPSLVDIRDYSLDKNSVHTTDLPEEFCIQGIHVKNQGGKATCVPYALSEIIEYHDCKDGSDYREFSTDFIYGFRGDTDYHGEGMHLRDGLKVIQKYGDVESKMFPGNSNVTTAMTKLQNNWAKLLESAYPNRISTYYKITNSDELKYSIYNHGPVVTSMKWFNRSKLDSNKIYQFDSNAEYSEHAVIVIGWTKDYWIVQNSWGKFWGNKGTFRILQDVAFKYVFFDTYGVTDDITPIKEPNSAVKFFGPLINKLINWFKRKFVK